MWTKLIQIWKAKDLRNSLAFILMMLVIFRFAAHIPIPGVNTQALSNFFSDNQILGMLNIFSGGGLENFSIVMMGVAPYITSSIIFQLLAMTIPKVRFVRINERCQILLKPAQMNIAPRATIRISFFLLIFLAK